MKRQGKSLQFSLIDVAIGLDAQLGDVGEKQLNSDSLNLRV